ncbi:SCA7, zinc-binding domain-containing protein [Fomitopsis serialis]|uniref:SCA7, zinc-binding domain-containing protein n=1 Tax=Fomitopsis serialis TaxID=139415 RepID=UPI002007D8A5|nr:SCA7, zinc-binding domain-containing protein [Neoantrodia serialis]KAH9916338.1 SCA7, zinc-binding domain-containing protein [Neoantrodia serialis]
MALKLRPTHSPEPPPFSWDTLSAMPSPPSDTDAPASPPIPWLSAPDMKVFGAEPLKPEIGFVKCRDCAKPVLRSAVEAHAVNCAKLRAAMKKSGKGKEVEASKGKKRKAEDEEPTPEDPSAPKKKKPATKVTKGRFKGPVDYDKQCGVINDKGLPCSRSLTCKSHAMGAKRSVQGRSKPYDELLLEWNRQNNPNFVEPVKKESKEQRKERKEKEKADKKRQALEAAAAAGVDLTKKGAIAAVTGAATKKSKKGTAAATAAGAVAGATVAGQDDGYENLDELDSEAEVDSLIHAVRAAQNSGLIGVPLAVPCDAGSWFVARRERLRSCHQLMASALMPHSVGPGGARLA